jgi:hypothetical protein
LDEICWREGEDAEWRETARWGFWLGVKECQRIFMLSEKNIHRRMILQALWLLLISELSHRAWAYPIIEYGSEWNPKAVIIVNSDAEPATAAVLDSNLICVSSTKQ